MKKSNLLHVMMLGTCLTISLMSHHADAETGAAPALVTTAPIAAAAMPVIIAAPAMGAPTAATMPILITPTTLPPIPGIPTVGATTHACASGEMIANPYTSPSTGKCECPLASIKTIPNSNGTSAAYCYNAPATGAGSPTTLPPTPPGGTTITPPCMSPAGTGCNAGTPPKCGPNQILVGGICMTTQIQCGPGYIQMGNTCVAGSTGTPPAPPPPPPPTPSCAEQFGVTGMIKNASGICVCPEGTVVTPTTTAPGKACLKPSTGTQYGYVGGLLKASSSPTDPHISCVKPEATTPGPIQKVDCYGTGFISKVNGAPDKYSYNITQLWQHTSPRIQVTLTSSGNAHGDAQNMCATISAQIRSFYNSELAQARAAGVHGEYNAITVNYNVSVGYTDPSDPYNLKHAENTCTIPLGTVTW